MAKKNAKTPALPTPSAPEPKKVEVASFDKFAGDDVNVPDVEGWYTPEEGEAGWVGRIVGTFQIKTVDNDGKEQVRDVLVVRLLSDCSSVSLDGEPITLGAGQVMAVSIRAKLVPLLEYVEKHGIVGVRAIEKRSIGPNRSMWVFQIKGQPGMRVPREARTAEKPAGPASTLASGDMPW